MNTVVSLATIGMIIATLDYVSTSFGNPSFIAHVISHIQ